MPKEISPLLLGWFIQKGEMDSKEPWWPEILKLLDDKPEIIIFTLYESLPDLAAKATADLHTVVEVEFSYEFCGSIVDQMRQHFVAKK